MDFSPFVAKILWDEDVHLHELRKLEFASAFLNNTQNANYIKWSPNNQFFTFNLMDKLLIYELNIHHVAERFPFPNNSVGENLNCRMSQIKPEKLKFVSKRFPPRKFHMNPPQVAPRFIDHEFGPFQLSKNYHLLACLTDQNSLTIYANVIPFQWEMICNVSKLFIKTQQSSEYIEKFENEDDYHKKLDQIRITAFVWLPNVDYTNDLRPEVVYRMFISTRNGKIHLIQLILSDRKEYGLKIIKSIETNLKTIITLKIIDQVLLVQSNDGRLMLYDCDLKRKISLWQEADNRPGYNFAFKLNNSNILEIVYSKYQSILMIELDIADFSVKTFKNISINQPPMEDGEPQKSIYEDIFAVFNLRNHYCFTTFNNNIYAFQRKSLNNNLNDETLFLRKLTIPSFKKFDDIHFACVSASSNNGALIVILSNQYRFSGRLSNFKTNNVHLYLTTMLEPRQVTVTLNKRLLSNDSTISAKLADLLYLFRYNTLQTDCAQEQLNLMLDFLLKQVPFWFHQNSTKIQQLTLDGLGRIRFIRYLARYCLADLRKTTIKDKEKELLRKMVAKMNNLILKIHFKTIFHNLIDLESLKDPEKWKEHYKIEHLISLNNLIKADVLDFLPQNIKDNVMKLVKKELDLNGNSSIIADNPVVRHLSTSQPLIKVLNCCPFCSKQIIDPSIVYLDTSQDQLCDQHQVDVDCNSLIILNPLYYPMETCLKCQESKLLAITLDNLWPDPRTSPLKIGPNSCLFCL